MYKQPANPMETGRGLAFMCWLFIGNDGVEKKMETSVLLVTPNIKPLNS